MPRRSAALVAAVVAFAAASPFVACSTGDSICPDNTVEENREDECPYGPPGGPQRKNAERCTVAFDKSDCSVSFTDDVYPIFTAPYFEPRSGGGCTTKGCHTPGSQGAAKLLIEEGSTSQELYDALRDAKNDAGDPYVDPDNSNAWILCNLEAKLGGGSAMPPTAGLDDSGNTNDDDEDRAIVEKWVKCGMNFDGGGGGSAGGGGMGGAGGMGGGGGT